MGGLVCAAQRRKNRGFSTLKRTLDLGVEKGRLLQNSRPKGGLIQVVCYPTSPETVDITGFFEKFCIAIRTIKCLAPSGAGHFIVWNKDRTRTHPMGHSGGMSRPPVQTLVATIMSSSPVARTPLLLLSKSNPLRWASIWFLFILLLYQKSPRTIRCGDFFRMGSIDRTRTHPMGHSGGSQSALFCLTDG